MKRRTFLGTVAASGVAAGLGPAASASAADLAPVRGAPIGRQPE